MMSICKEIDKKYCAPVVNQFFRCCCNCENDGGEIGSSVTAYVTGAFADRAISAKTPGIVTPVPTTGNLEMIQGNRFIANQEGLYYLHCEASFVTTALSAPKHISTIVKNSDVENYKTAARAFNPNGRCMPSVNCLVYLKEGEYLTYHAYSEINQTSINSMDSDHQFVFVYLGK